MLTLKDYHAQLMRDGHYRLAAGVSLVAEWCGWTHPATRELMTRAEALA